MVQYLNRYVVYRVWGTF